MPEQRVVIFIDYQNMFNWARRHFHAPPITDCTAGQFDPLAMGNLICSRPQPGFTRQLEEVRVYVGRPHEGIDPVTYKAHFNQCLAWKRNDITVISRPLKYMGRVGRQKGIDVHLAIDFIAHAIDGKYDVGIIISADTDLAPALDFVITRHGARCRVEVAAWLGSGNSPRLNAKTCPIYCHWFKQNDYNSLADSFNYNF